jgi:hypothetical protein
VKTSQLYLGAIVVGVIALVVGILFEMKLFGNHHILPYAALGVGVVLLLVGIVGMVVGRSKSAAS